MELSLGARATTTGIPTFWAGAQDIFFPLELTMAYAAFGAFRTLSTHTSTHLSTRHWINWGILGSFAGNSRDD